MWENGALKAPTEKNLREQNELAISSCCFGVKDVNYLSTTHEIGVFLKHFKHR